MSNGAECPVVPGWAAIGVEVGGEPAQHAVVNPVGKTEANGLVTPVCIRRRRSTDLVQTHAEGCGTPGTGGTPS